MNIISITLYSVITFFLIIHIKSRRQTLIDHRVIFVLLFLGLQIIASLRLFGTVECRESIFVMMILAVVAYMFGSICAPKKSIVYNGHPISRMFDVKIRYSFAYALILLAIIVMIPYAMNIRNIILGSSLSEGLLTVRRAAGTGEGAVYAGTSSMQNMLFLLIVEPACYALPPLAATDLLYGKKDKKLLIGTLIVIVLKTIFAVNRASLAYAAIMFFLVFIFNKKVMILSRRQKLIIGITVVALLGGMMYISSIRAFDSFERQLFIYFGGAMHNFEVRLDDIKNSNLITCGAASLYGFYNTFLSIIRAFIGFDYPKWYESLVEMISSLESFYSIGGQISMNAFVTPLWFLYLDGRYVGVFVGMFIYGYVNEKARCLCFTQHNSRTDSIYALLVLGVIFSMVRLHFANYGYAIGLVLILLLTNGSSYYHERNL